MRKRIVGTTLALMATLSACGGSTGAVEEWLAGENLRFGGNDCQIQEEEPEEARAMMVLLFADMDVDDFSRSEIEDLEELGLTPEDVIEKGPDAAVNALKSFCSDR